MKASALYNALSVLSLWASTTAAQPIALKLNVDGYEKQQADPEFIASLFERARQPPKQASGKTGKWSLGTPTHPLEARKGGKGGIKVNPLIKGAGPKRLLARLARTAKRNSAAKAPNFDLWYQVDVDDDDDDDDDDGDDETTGNEARSTHNKTAKPPRLSKGTLNLLHRLAELPEVASAHALKPGPPPQNNPDDDPRRTKQGYLNPAPQGINAPFGWEWFGGDGANVTIVDIEQGWNFEHEDLLAAGITLLPGGNNKVYFSHGTAVLGQMFMTDNTVGGVGIVPAAKGYAVSQHRTVGGYNTAEAILDAADNMEYGDIMLLEAQEYNPVSGEYYWPVEVADANYEAIEAAAARGIIVVQAGCNGRNDLDAYIDPRGKRVFDRSSPDFRDSGSIMVGGSNAAVPHTRWDGTNYGSRIDVYSWAADVDTAYTDDDTGTKNDLYTATFGGTSGASPIIVGAAAIVQGITFAMIGRKRGPIEMRSILSAHGTPSANPAKDRIGVQPDLKQILDNLQFF